MFDNNRINNVKNIKFISKLIKNGTKLVSINYKILQKILKKDNPQDFIFIVEKKIGFMRIPFQFCPLNQKYIVLNNF